MADLVKLTIDGRDVQAAPGTLVIDAAKKVGIEIPAFCYYEGLSLQAACRMCLVEIEKMPKLQAGCTIPAAEGQVVRPDSARGRAGGPHRHRPTEEGSQINARIPADESSARLPRVRQGRRVRVAGHG